MEFWWSFDGVLMEFWYIVILRWWSFDGDHNYMYIWNSEWGNTKPNIHWSVVWNMNFMTFHSVGNVIIPTEQYFSEGLKPPNSNNYNWVLIYIYINDIKNHHETYIYIYSNVYDILVYDGFIPIYYWTIFECFRYIHTYISYIYMPIWPHIYIYIYTAMMIHWFSDPSFDICCWYFDFEYLSSILSIYTIYYIYTYLVNSFVIQNIRWLLFSWESCNVGSPMP